MRGFVPRSERSHHELAPGAWMPHADRQRLHRALTDERGGPNVLLSQWWVPLWDAAPRGRAVCRYCAETGHA